MYLMGLFLLPEGIHSAFDRDLARFFWQGANGRPKYHMVKWADICLPKSLGGPWDFRSPAHELGSDAQMGLAHPLRGWRPLASDHLS